VRGFRVDFRGAFFGIKLVQYNSRMKAWERQNEGCSRME
jgi:hypothetical protein